MLKQNSVETCFSFGVNMVLDLSTSRASKAELGARKIYTTLTKTRILRAN